MSTKWVNWARTAVSYPVLDITPNHSEHVVLAVQRARETGRTLKPIGASHSFTDIGATDGIRLRMEEMRGLVEVDVDRGQVTLQAGTYLWELPMLIHPFGLALQNMGDIDRQTISGALSTGTHGTGIGYGGLATTVVGVTLVTGLGEVLTVNKNEHPELLPAVSLGIGALGVLLTVTLQCVPRYQLHAVESPAPLAQVLDTFEERHYANDHFEFYWFPHTDGVRTKVNTRVPLEQAGDSLGRIAKFIDEELANNIALGSLAELQRWAPALTPALNRLISSISSTRAYTDESNRVFVTHRRVKFREMEYGLPLEAVPQAMRELRNMIERKRFRVSFPVEVRSAGADRVWLSTSYERNTGYIAVHRYQRDTDHDYFREAEAIFVAHGGRPHWGKIHTKTFAELQTMYPRFDSFLAVRNQLDPERIFRNQYLDRVLEA